MTPATPCICYDTGVRCSHPSCPRLHYSASHVRDSPPCKRARTARYSPCCSKVSLISELACPRYTTVAVPRHVTPPCRRAVDRRQRVTPPRCRRVAARSTAEALLGGRQAVEQHRLTEQADAGRVGASIAGVECSVGGGACPRAPACTGKRRPSDRQIEVELVLASWPAVDQLTPLGSMARGARPWIRAYFARPFPPTQLGFFMLVMRGMSYAEPSHARRLLSCFACFFLISCMGRIGRMGLFWTPKEIQSRDAETEIQPPCSCPA